ncbi:unnamed protein product, partial [Effrenium voratum]
MQDEACSEVPTENLAEASKMPVLTEVSTEVRLAAMLPRIGTPSLQFHVQQWGKQSKQSRPSTSLQGFSHSPGSGMDFRATCPASFASLRKPQLESLTSLTRPFREPPVDKKLVLQAERSAAVIQQNSR